MVGVVARPMMSIERPGLAFWQRRAIGVLQCLSVLPLGYGRSAAPSAVGSAFASGGQSRYTMRGGERLTRVCGKTWLFRHIDESRQHFQIST